MSHTPGYLVRVFYGSGDGVAYSDEAMEEVDLTPRYPRYTAWRIAADAKQIMIDSPAPTFQYQDEGSGPWATLTPDEIWYGTGIIIVNSGLDSGDLVRCHSGKYLAPVSIFACANRNVEKLLNEIDTTVYGDEAKTCTWGAKDWKADLTVLYAGIAASATSTGGAANSHITAEHWPGGTAGNGATFDLQDNGSSALSVSVVDDDIVVDLDTDLGSPISTAKEVVQALNDDPAVRALGISFKVASGETGLGVVADSGPYTLSGGVDPIDFEDLEGVRMAFRFYSNVNAHTMDVGFGFITRLKYTGDPKDIVKGEMAVTGKEYPMHRVTG